MRQRDNSSFRVVGSRSGNDGGQLLNCLSPWTIEFFDTRLFVFQCHTYQHPTKEKKNIQYPWKECFLPHDRSHRRAHHQLVPEQGKISTAPSLARHTLTRRVAERPYGATPTQLFFYIVDIHTYRSAFVHHDFGGRTDRSVRDRRDRPISVPILSSALTFFILK